MISPSQRQPDNTQHSQQTNIHAPGGIPTHDRSRRAAVDLRLRPRGYWDRHLFKVKHTNLRSAFRTTNKISNVFKTGFPRTNNVYDTSGIYDLPCATCLINYVGQTGRTLKQPYSEHIRYVRYSNRHSACVSHILQHALQYGSVENTVTVINRDSKPKGRLMNILEQPFIQNSVVVKALRY